MIPFNSRTVSVKISIIFFLIFCNVTTYLTHEIRKRYTLLFPRTTVLQLTYGVAIPIVLRNRRQFVVDNAWQQNFDLPFNLTNFRVATYYVRSAASSVDLSRETLYVYIMNTLDNHNHCIIEKLISRLILQVETPNLLCYECRYNSKKRLELDGEQCLLRAICDVAHTPFHVKQKNSLLEKIAQFIFTPTKNYNFDLDLQEERGMDNMTFGQTLLYAQDVGKRGMDCEEIFPKCIISIIDLISQKYHLN